MTRYTKSTVSKFLNPLLLRNQGELSRYLEEKESLMNQYNRTRNSLQQQLEEYKRQLEEETKVRDYFCKS